MMFPYPSAEGLHVGHIIPFAGGDIYGHAPSLPPSCRADGALEKAAGFFLELKLAVGVLGLVCEGADAGTGRNDTGDPRRRSG